jgi:hypothetical protein
VVFSLRPESIQLADRLASNSSLVRFRGSIRQQIYSGASELLEIECARGQRLRARIPARGPLSGEQDFAFSAADAVLLRE